MIAEENKVVSIDYTLKNADGDVLDTSEGREPLDYLHGAGNIIPGLEEAISGKTTGESLQAVIAPAQGYGERHDEQVAKVPRADLAGIDNVTVGMQLQAETPQGPRVVQVIEVEEETVTIDANHPLAGMTLHFDVRVTGVRDATAEEIEHGHVR